MEQQLRTRARLGLASRADERSLSWPLLAGQTAIAGIIEWMPTIRDEISKMTSGLWP
jgi:hypothetical protein